MNDGIYTIIHPNIKTVMSKLQITDFLPDVIQRVFTPTQFQRIVADHRELWEIEGSLTTTELIDFLLQASDLSKVTFDFPSRPQTRYVWGKAHPIEIGQSLLTPKGYLCHSSAMAFHKLSTDEPDVWYLNEEQKPNPASRNNLTQERMHAAFNKRPRISNNKATYKNNTFCILNGMLTNGLGIISIQQENGLPIRVTSLERTLIDIVVRPFYAGGVEKVLQAYREAAGKFSIESMGALYEELSYTYPYHQAIGFYLSTAGSYNLKEISVFSKMEKSFDFYLAPQISCPAHSKEWRIYYPNSLQ